MTTKIASIYFAPVYAERTAYQGYYNLPAVAAGTDPFILPIEDAVERWQGPFMGDRRRSQHSRMWESYLIAHDIVAQWTERGEHMSPTCHPGIWVVRDRLPIMKADGSGQTEVDAMGRAQFRDATEAEKSAMWQEDLLAAQIADAAYGRALFDWGNSQADDPRLIQHLRQYQGTLIKAAAARYGFEADWLKEGVSNLTKACPYCTKQIRTSAIKCPNCHEIVNAIRYNELRAQETQITPLPVKIQLPDMEGLGGKRKAS